MSTRPNRDQPIKWVKYFGKPNLLTADYPPDKISTADNPPLVVGGLIRDRIFFGIWLGKSNMRGPSHINLS
jgi:hypothetical protein